MVISNEGEHFCVGANLFAVVMAAGQKQWDAIARDGQGLPVRDAAHEVRAVPVVAAPYGMTLGGGLELCFGCDAVQAAAETYSGLVEVGVGLIPGGAGTLNMLWRALEGVPEGVDVDIYAFVTQVFKNIALAKVATSAEEAQGVRLLPLDRRRLVRPRAPAPRGQAARDRPGERRLPPADAARLPAARRERHRHAADDGRHAASPATTPASTTRRSRGSSPTSCAAASAAPPTRSPRTRSSSSSARRSCRLCGEPKSQERMQYMLMNNKPLRN